MVLAGGDKFNHKWELAIVGLLTKNDLQGAAAHAGVSVNTLLRWLQQDEFQNSYKQAKQQTLKQAVGQLQSAAGEAVQVLRDVAGDDTVSPSARVSAARTILDGAIKVTELQDLEERLTELEKQQKGVI
jgi:hypothetical protein